MDKSIIATNDTSAAVARSMDQTASSVHNAIDRTAGAVHPAVDHIAMSAHKTVDKLADSATLAAATLNEQGNHLIEAQTRIAASCRAQVRAKPFTSMGIAVAAGFVLSWLLSRR